MHRYIFRDDGRTTLLMVFQSLQTFLFITVYSSISLPAYKPTPKILIEKHFQNRWLAYKQTYFSYPVFTFQTVIFGLKWLSFMVKKIISVSSFTSSSELKILFNIIFISRISSGDSENEKILSQWIGPVKVPGEVVIFTYYPAKHISRIEKNSSESVQNISAYTRVYTVMQFFFKVWTEY